MSVRKIDASSSGARVQIRFALMFAIPICGVALFGSEAHPTEIEWASSYQLAMEQARAEDKLVMVDFYTHWCGWCKVLDKKTYSDAKVAQEADRMVNVKINAESDVATATRYGVQAYPTVLFLNPDGTVRQTMQGFRPPEQFLPLLGQVLDTSGERMQLAHRIDVAPRDPSLRRAFADLLAIDGRWQEARAQLDTLLLVVEQDEARTEAVLDGAIWSYRSGAAAQAREALKDWIDDHRKHPRAIEARYFLGLVHVELGKEKDARKLFRQVQKDGAGSWFALGARHQLTNLEG